MLSGPSTPPATETWKGRAIIHCRGHQTELGCLLCAVLGIVPKTAPRIHCGQGTSFISKTGYLVADMQKRGQDRYYATVLGKVEEIRDRFRRLADAIKCDDKEREEMFHLLRAWMGKDLRATSNLELWTPPRPFH